MYICIHKRPLENQVFLPLKGYRFQIILNNNNNNNLLKNMDSGQINCIVFLDVRKAFDSIKHEILIDKMRNFFGVTGNQLRWFESYLNNRVQQCLINGHYRAPKG
jgi:hypothetical protein